MQIREVTPRQAGPDAPDPKSGEKHSKEVEGRNVAAQAAPRQKSGAGVPFPAPPAVQGPVHPLLRGYGRNPPSLNAERRGRYLDQLSEELKAAQAGIKQQLQQLPPAWLGPGAAEMAASIDREIADLDAHRRDAVAGTRQMDAQMARAKAIWSQMTSLSEQVEKRVREQMENQANLFDRAVRADLRTTQGMIAGHYTITEPARERVRVLAQSMVPELDLKKQDYLALQSRRAPQQEIDQALQEYHAAAVKALSYVQQSGAAESAALDKRIKRLDLAIAVTRFIRDASVAVGAMLIPGAQGVGLASGVAAVGALGLMHTGAQLADERPGGGHWTPGAAGKAALKNTANVAVDALAGARYMKLGKEMISAASMIRKGQLMAKAAALGVASGTAHRSIEGQGWKAFDPKRALADGVISAGTFGLNAKLAPAMAKLTPLVRHTGNAAFGATMGAGAQVVINAADGRPLGENLGPATIQALAASVVSGYAMAETGGSTRGDPESTGRTEAMPAENIGTERSAPPLLTPQDLNELSSAYNRLPKEAQEAFHDSEAKFIDEVHGAFGELPEAAQRAYGNSSASYFKEIAGEFYRLSEESRNELGSLRRYFGLAHEFNKLFPEQAQGRSGDRLALLKSIQEAEFRRKIEEAFAGLPKEKQEAYGSPSGYLKKITEEFGKLPRKWRAELGSPRRYFNLVQVFNALSEARQGQFGTPLGYLKEIGEVFSVFPVFQGEFGTPLRFLEEFGQEFNRLSPDERAEFEDPLRFFSNIVLEFNELPPATQEVLGNPLRAYKISQRFSGLSDAQQKQFGYNLYRYARSLGEPGVSPGGDETSGPEGKL
jgi:hypothetical protein